MYDSIQPERIPHGARRVCLYRNGSWAAAEAWFTRWERVYAIDVVGDAPVACSILDVETGDARPEQIPAWVSARLQAHPHGLARIYCGLGAWRECRNQALALPPEIRDRIRWWVANPTGRKHLVPGSSATQWRWGPDFDESTVTRSWDD